MAFNIDLNLTLSVVAASLVSTVLAETLNYIFVYSKEEFKSLSSNIKNLNKKLEKAEEETSGGIQNKKVSKKISEIENRVKVLNAELSMKKFKSTFLIGIVMILTITSLSNYFSGAKVAKLPFEPFYLIRGITHRGLEGEDYTDCSFIFLFILTGFVLRGNIHKIFGFEIESNFNPFNQPNNKLFK